MQGLVKRVGQWWGYLDLGPDPADRRAKPPASEWLVRPAKAGREAQSIWAPLTDEIEARWYDRFGQKAVDDLGSALTDLVARLDVDLPDYLLGEPRLRPRPPIDGDSQLPLTALLAKVLLALALDFDDHSDLSLGIYTAGVGSRLPICANVLCLIGDDGVAVVKIPELSGADKMAIDNWVGILDKRAYIQVAADPGGPRRRAAQLTPKGVRGPRRLLPVDGVHRGSRAGRPIIGGGPASTAGRRTNSPRSRSWFASLEGHGAVPGRMAERDSAATSALTLSGGDDPGRLPGRKLRRDETPLPDLDLPRLKDGDMGRTPRETTTHNH
jgi:hypothetical protein